MACVASEWAAGGNVVLSAADVIISTHSHDVICRGDLFARTQRKGEGLEREEGRLISLLYYIHITDTPNMACVMTPEPRLIEEWEGKF